MRYFVAFEDAEGLMGASLSPDMTFVEARGHLLVLTSELPLEAIQAWWHDLEVHTAYTEATLDNSDTLATEHSDDTTLAVEAPAIEAEEALYSSSDIDEDSPRCSDCIRSLRRALFHQH